MLHPNPSAALDPAYQHFPAAIHANFMPSALPIGFQPIPQPTMQHVAAPPQFMAPASNSAHMPQPVNPALLNLAQMMWGSVMQHLSGANGV